MLDKTNLKRTDIENPATKQWDIIIRNNENCNYEFIIFLLRNHLKKTEVETINLLAELDASGFIIVATYIAEVAVTIKSNMEIIAIKNEVNLHIEVAPTE